ncbi:glycosyltransferase [Zooshikella sp. RANM57]|uniref:glycosyltransferase n=1 Tax=Zooshikella sp. RANM57 TaxID=3425863 RepID=UPI003D6F255E
MKILTVLDSYPPDLNGGAYFTHRLAQSLVHRNHDVLVICPSRTMKSCYDTYEGVNLFRVRSFPALIYKNFRVCWPIFIRKEIEKAILKFNPEVIHLQGRFFLGDICSKVGEKFHIPMVATNHFMPENFFHYTHLPLKVEKYFNELAWLWVKKMFEKAVLYSTPTKTAAELLRKLNLPGEILPISCGVDLEIFKPREKNTLLAKRFGLKNIPTVLYAGRLDKEKNIDTIIYAIKEVNKTVECQLIITGVGNEYNEILKLVKKLAIDDKVYFTKYLSNAEYPHVFSLVDCFIHAGTAELQSIVTLEAVASGLPIVAANAMALPELVIEGDNGFLFEPHDYKQAAACLLKIIKDNNLITKIKERSRCLAYKHSIQKTTECYEKLYLKAIEYFYEKG